MATIKLETNVPKELVLQAFGGNGIFGKPEDSKRFFEADGVTPQRQLRFSTTEGPLYLSEFAGMQINDQLKSLNVQPGERIVAVKKEIPNSGKKPIVKYFVDRPAGTMPPPSGNGNGYHPPAPPQKIPYSIFLRQAIKETAEALKENGEQWSDASRQGMVSTLIIQAGREGVLSWTTPLPAEPTELEQQLAASIAMVNERKAQQSTTAAPSHAPQQTNDTSQFTTPAKKPWTGFGQMCKSFERLKTASGLPWPMYYDTLKQFGVQHCNQLRNESAAWACYQKLCERIQDYHGNPQPPDTYQHFEAEQGGWA